MSNGGMLALGLGLAGFMMGGVGAYFGFKAEADTAWLHDQYAADSETLEAIAEDLRATKSGLQSANAQTVAARKDAAIVTEQLGKLQQMVFDMEWQLERIAEAKRVPRISADGPSMDLTAAAELSELRRKLLDGSVGDAELATLLVLGIKYKRLTGIVKDLESAIAEHPDDVRFAATLAKAQAAAKSSDPATPRRLEDE